MTTNHLLSINYILSPLSSQEPFWITIAIPTFQLKNPQGLVIAYGMWLVVQTNSLEFSFKFLLQPSLLCIFITKILRVLLKNWDINSYLGFFQGQNAYPLRIEERMPPWKQICQITLWLNPQVMKIRKRLCLYHTYNILYKYTNILFLIISNCGKKFGDIFPFSLRSCINASHSHIIPLLFISEAVHLSREITVKWGFQSRSGLYPLHLNFPVYKVNE